MTYLSSWTTLAIHLVLPEVACRQRSRFPNIRLAMIEYRPFRNLDPPALCEIWRNHPPVRALFQPMTPVVLEDTVLSKPFFDREGLIVATDDQRPVGFVHAGFGPNAAGTALDPPIGATCMLMVSHHDQRTDIAEQLLRHSEAYLIRSVVRGRCRAVERHPWHHSMPVCMVAARCLASWRAIMR